MGGDTKKNARPVKGGQKNNTRKHRNEENEMKKPGSRIEQKKKGGKKEKRE